MAPALQTTTRDRSFPSTRWTVVRQAADSQTSSEHALDALSELCRIYWRPVYLFVRRQGISQHDAQDLTQGFFADLIESRAYARADPTKGRFRSFLLATLKHFVAHARDRECAQKRGGGNVPVQLDEMTVSEAEMYALRSTNHSVDAVFEREWAASLARQALDRLAQEYELGGKGALFEALKSRLTAGEAAAIPYEELANRFGHTAAHLRVDVTRLRARYRAILREEVCGTVVDPSDVDEELRYLRQAMIA